MGLIVVPRAAFFVLFSGAKIGHFWPMENTPSARFLYHKCGKLAINSCFITCFWALANVFSRANWQIFGEIERTFGVGWGIGHKKTETLHREVPLSVSEKCCYFNFQLWHQSHRRRDLEVLCWHVRNDFCKDIHFGNVLNASGLNLIIKPIQTLLPAYQLRNVNQGSSLFCRCKDTAFSSRGKYPLCSILLYHK